MLDATQVGEASVGDLFAAGNLQRFRCRRNSPWNAGTAQVGHGCVRQPFAARRIDGGNAFQGSERVISNANTPRYIKLLDALDMLEGAVGAGDALAAAEIQNFDAGQVDEPGVGRMAAVGDVERVKPRTA